MNENTQLGMGEPFHACSFLFEGFGLGRRDKCLRGQKERNQTENQKFRFHITKIMYGLVNKGTNFFRIFVYLCKKLLSLQQKIFFT